MMQLNLPPVKVNVRQIEGKYHIFDVIRKKFLVLTPEEWVRQHIVHYLIDHHGYSKSLMLLEGGLKYNRLLKRSDILIYDQNGKPYFLIECKSFEVKLNQKSIEQVAVYNKTIRAQYIMITNGINHYCCNFNSNHKKYETYSDIPPAISQTVNEK